MKNVIKTNTKLKFVVTAEIYKSIYVAYLFFCHRGIEHQDSTFDDTEDLVIKEFTLAVLNKNFGSMN